MDVQFIGASNDPNAPPPPGAWAWSSRTEHESQGHYRRTLSQGLLGQTAETAEVLSDDSALGNAGGSYRSYITVEGSDECTNSVLYIPNGAQALDGEEASSGNPGAGRGGENTAGDKDIDLCSPPLSLIKQQQRDRARVHTAALECTLSDV